MRFYLAFVVSMLGLYSQAVGQESAFSKSEFSIGGSWAVGIQSQSLKPRFSRVIYDKPILTADLTLEFKKDTDTFFANVGGTTDIGDLHKFNLSSTAGDGFDLTLGWRGKVLGLDTKVSFGYIDFFPLEEARGDLLVGSLIVSKKFELGECEGKHFLRPEMRADYLFSAQDVRTSALVLMPNVRHVWQAPFGIESVSLFDQVGLEWNGELGKNSGDGVFAQISLGLEWQLEDNCKLVPSFTLVTPLRDSHDGRRTETLFGLNAVFSF